MTEHEMLQGARKLLTVCTHTRAGESVSSSLIQN